MKKTIMIAVSSLFLVAVSCDKKSEGNKSVIKQESGYSEDLPKDSLLVRDEITEGNTTAAEYTDRYVGEDGSSALVTFKNTEEDKSISIRSNNKTIAAPQKESKSGGAVYGNFDYEIISKNDSITITQGDNVISLKKARPN